MCLLVLQLPYPKAARMDEGDGKPGWRCDVCYRDFNSQRSRNKHRKEKHPDAPPRREQVPPHVKAEFRRVQMVAIRRAYREREQEKKRSKEEVSPS